MSAAPSSHSSHSSAAARTRALRANSFAAIVILLIELALGVWVNLYGHLPASDHGANVASGYAKAVSDGPVGLSIHAVLGAILVISAVAALVRAIRIRRAAMVGATAVGLLAIVSAAFSGASFVGNGDNGASMGMAVAAAVGVGAYALVLLLSTGSGAAGAAHDR